MFLKNKNVSFFKNNSFYVALIERLDEIKQNCIDIIQGMKDTLEEEDKEMEESVFVPLPKSASTVRNESPLFQSFHEIIKSLKDQLFDLSSMCLEQEKLIQLSDEKQKCLYENNQLKARNLMENQRENKNNDKTDLSFNSVKDDVTQRMIYVLYNYRSSHDLYPLIPNAQGNYPPIHWQSLGGNKNWLEEWKKIKENTKYGLFTPPLILPPWYGGWLFYLVIHWRPGLGLLLCGAFILREFNKNCPNKMNLPLKLDLEFLPNVKIKIRFESIIMKKKTTSENFFRKYFLCSICDEMDDNWMAPTAWLVIPPPPPS